MEARIPAQVFPPGEFLGDELEKRGWSQVEFAEIIGRPPRVVNEILAGKRAITPETAKEIAAALGTSPHYWLNLESAYRLGTQPAAPRIARLAELRTQFPAMRDLINRKWIAGSKNPDELEAALLRFYGLAARGQERRLAHAAKRNDYSGDSDSATG
ncbi:MAG: HigA family addiction module antitoxin, partial [Longimicrobiales bacterium]